MKIFTETPRLILRELLPTDVEGMFELDNDPEVHLYLGNKTVSSREQALENIHFIRQQYLDNGIGRWAMIEKATGNFIGWTGFKLITEQTNNHINYYDLGYRLIKRYWEKGFATESAMASLDYAFTHLGANEVFAIADCENKGSHKILTKVGLQFVESFNLDGIMHNWYELRKESFKNPNV